MSLSKLDEIASKVGKATEKTKTPRRVVDVEKEFKRRITAIQEVIGQKHFAKHKLASVMDGRSWIIYQGTRSNVCLRVRRGLPMSIYRPFLLHELRTNEITSGLFEQTPAGLQPR